MGKTELLEQLHKECSGCDKCQLCATRTNLVFGVGSAESRIMFIGEGPGEQEDLRGEPFVGRAGKLLDLMLDAVDLSRQSNIYIANIVKCRPPKNRDPLPEEQDGCIGWLERQVDIIKPEVIVCLGRIASARIIKQDIKITREHGLFFRKTVDFSGRGEGGKVLMMPMLHPAAILRNPNQKPEAFADFLRLRDYLEGSLTEEDMHVTELDS